MEKTTMMNIIDQICEEKGIDEKFLSFGWIRELKKNGKVTHIVRNNFDLNPSSCMTIVNDKYATYEVLKENNIPVLEHDIVFNPKTREEYSKKVEEQVRNYFNKYNGKIVIKTNNSSAGKGVFLFEDEETAILKVEELFEVEKEDNINICPFENIDYEYRVIYLDGEILYLYKKEKSEDSWKHNLANGAIPVKVEDNDPNKEEIIKIAKDSGFAVNAKFVSIDISKSKDGRLFVMEINGSVCMSKFAEMFPGGYAIAKGIYEKAMDLMFN